MKIDSVKIDVERPWQLRLYDRIRVSQEDIVLWRDGGRWGIFVRHDLPAKRWRRLEKMRLRVTAWINAAFAERATLKREAAEHAEEMQDLEYEAKEMSEKWDT